MQNVVEDVLLKLECLSIEPTPVLSAIITSCFWKLGSGEREINDTISVDRHSRLNLPYNEQ